MPNDTNCQVINMPIHQLKRNANLIIAGVISPEPTYQTVIRFHQTLCSGFNQWHHRPTLNNKQPSRLLPMQVIWRNCVRRQDLTVIIGTLMVHLTALATDWCVVSAVILSACFCTCLFLLFPHCFSMTAWQKLLNGLPSNLTNTHRSNDKWSSGSFKLHKL